MREARTKRAQIFDAVYGDWNGAAYIAWVSSNITDFCAEKGLDQYGLEFLDANLNGDFDRWLEERYGVTV